MKKFVFSCLFAGFFASSVFAEGGILVGGGMTFSNVSVSDDLKKDSISGQPADLSYSFRPGVKINWYYWYKVTEQIGVIAGVNFESRGANITRAYKKIDPVSLTSKDTKESDHIKFHYLNIPLYVSYTILPEIVPGIMNDLNVSLGPDIGVVARMNDEAPIEAVKTIDLGASLNCSVAFLNMFSLGAGYQLGLTNVLKKIEGDAVTSSLKHSAIKVFVNYIYRVKT